MMAERWEPTTKEQLRRLDQLENQARRRWSEYLSRVATAVEPLVFGRTRTPAQVAAATIPLPGLLHRLMVEQDRYMLMTGMAHADYEVRRLRARYAPRQLADTPLARLENIFRVIPQDAIDALEARDLILAGDVEADVLTGLKRISLRGLAGELRPREQEAAVQELLETTAARARNIITTNGTWAYNRGRLAQFAEGEVGHVLFRAILDRVTSHQCRTRHGRIMALTDPRLKENTPPLHGHCRSLLSPVIAEFEPDLMNESWRFDWSGSAALPKGWSTR